MAYLDFLGLLCLSFESKIGRIYTCVIPKKTKQGMMNQPHIKKKAAKPEDIWREQVWVDKKAKNV